MSEIEKYSIEDVWTLIEYEGGISEAMAWGLQPDAIADPVLADLWGRTQKEWIKFDRFSREVYNYIDRKINLVRKSK